MLSTGKLLPLLPLGVVMVQGWRQHCIWEEPTAGGQRYTETGALNGWHIGTKNDRVKLEVVIV